MQLHYQFLCALIIFFIINLSDDTTCSPQAKLIARWGDKLGSELWALAKVITHKQDFESGYTNVELERKDPKKIIEEIVGNVSYMMAKKMEAVNCIIEAAEEAAKHFDLNETERNYTYYRSNPPDIYDTEEKEIPDSEMYMEMSLNNDTHFFNLAVNTNYSSAHVPINVYHKHNEPESVIKWSQELNDVFIQNYNADPALSWQYFGSSSGIMRHYPAMKWGSKNRGLFDCRIRTWFIEAATCTKDVVIVLDNSGSMTGMNKHIASLVVHTILDTLSNNDYINIMHYAEMVNYTVECFEEKIVQATEENIKVFKNAVEMLKPNNKSFVDSGLTEAFILLHKYRDLRNCSSTSKFCNQAIMIISDGISTNVSDVVEKYNRLGNESSIPIRIFTFIVGKEATDLKQAEWLACTNRGYFSHVDALEQVTAAVYQYVLVFARPLVLHFKHPLSWTHAYYDDTFDFENPAGRKFEKYRLLTSVAGPVLDLKAQEDNETQTANLLGVAATDVPVADIAKLMYPYKTGVNSHSFIVSNNGYVLKHPDLRPMFEQILKDNYNSIDLTEVEQFDDDLGPREVSEVLLELRDALVNGDESVIHDVKIKYHYDDMRRVSREINDYYFAPINGTPFSIGFAMPDLYGNYSIEVGDVIELYKFSTINISSFFNDTNWKIHPKWVYCKYHYLEGHEYDTPEKELLHFLNQINTDSFKWSMQYEKEAERQRSNKTRCGAKTLGDEAYYCDRNLVQRLVYDAQLTKPTFDSRWTARSPVENDLRALYNATTRFVATMSGLTRWEYLYNHDPNSTTFGDDHPRAIDEVWYKSAVIQHRYSANSFVYAVPFDSQENKDLMVTGSFAIFPEKNGISAPAAVVGFQFSHTRLKEQFFNITSRAHRCQECLSCESGLDCFVIDHSGYIVLSKEEEYTGEFFGEIDGAVMEAMITERIFEKVTIRDYQAICYYYAWLSGDGNILIAPFYNLMLAIKWILSQIVWLFIKTNLHQFWNPNWVDAHKQYETRTMATYATPATITKCNKKCKEEEENWHLSNQIPKYTQAHTACEKERDLYVLQQQVLHDDLYPDGVKAKICDRYDAHKPFYIKMIPHSNLLLVAIQASYKVSTPCHFIHNTRIRDIVYENETYFPCQKLYLNNLKRRPLQDCYNEHPLEKEIKQCGKSARISFSNLLLIISSTFIMHA